jgi:hypothetical protein
VAIREVHMHWGKGIMVHEKERVTFEGQGRGHLAEESPALNQGLKVKEVGGKALDLVKVRLVVDKPGVGGVVRHFRLEYRPTIQKNRLTTLSGWKEPVRVYEMVVSGIPSEEIQGVG